MVWYLCTWVIFKAFTILVSRAKIPNTHAGDVFRLTFLLVLSCLGVGGTVTLLLFFLHSLPSSRPVFHKCSRKVRATWCRFSYLFYGIFANHLSLRHLHTSQNVRLWSPSHKYIPASLPLNFCIQAGKCFIKISTGEQDSLHILIKSYRISLKSAKTLFFHTTQLVS